MTIISGMHTTSNINSSRLVINMAKEVVLYEPEAAPLCTALMNLRKNNERGDSYKHEWLDVPGTPDYVNSSASATATAGASTLTIANYSYLRANMTLHNDRTGEVAKVIATPTTSTVSVYRGLGGTVAAVLGTDNWFLSSGEGQGGDLPVARTIREENYYNYQQNFRESLQVARELNYYNMYGPSDRDLQTKTTGVNLLKKIERAMLFGELAATTDASGYPQYFMKGLVSPLGWIQTNRHDFGGTVTADDLNAEIAATFGRGSSPEKLAICGDGALRTIDSFGGSKLQTTPGSQQKFGFSTKEWISSFGPINLVRSQLLQGVYSNAMILLDMKYLAYIPVREPSIEKDIVKDGSDRVTDAWIATCTLRARNEGVHGFFYGF